MIVFDLSCNCGTNFEGWFLDSDDFERQSREGLLVCPVCEGNEVRKILSPVSVRSKGARNISDTTAGEVSPEQFAARLLKKVQDHVLTNYENVGAEFANKTLKIHYGLEDPRNIRGTATAEEEKMLKKEGIELLKIPLPEKSDKN